jgi:hypothetical protein
VKPRQPDKDSSSRNSYRPGAKPSSVTAPNAFDIEEDKERVPTRNQAFRFPVPKHGEVEPR